MTKILISVLAIVNGGFMLLDGIYVMVNGKYIGPEKPGPWSYLFKLLNVDVFKLGPLFIFFGLSWLVFLSAFWFPKRWTFPFGIFLAAFTLWYLPFGTLISFIVIFLLFSSRRRNADSSKSQ